VLGIAGRRVARNAQHFGLALEFLDPIAGVVQLGAQCGARSDRVVDPL